MKKIIFGAGYYGKKALMELGEEQVYCFIDNDEEKQDKGFCDKRVISIDEYKNSYNEFEVIIASRRFREIERQLESHCVGSFSVWFPRYTQFSDDSKLIVNNYEDRSPTLSESEKVDPEKEHIQFLNDCTDALFKQKPLFNHIEIETYNRCNGRCAFCPVHAGHDPREECYMTEELFYRIVDELSEIDYKGCMALFSNNEPFLDERIIKFHRIVRSRIPKARMHLFTNGTKLTMEKFVEIVQYLDELIINNYNEKNELNNNQRLVVEYCAKHPELIKKVTIVMRHPYEVLETRGGTAPNRKKRAVYSNAKCTHPFRQMIVRSNGKVSLCCNDAIGVTDMGDVERESLIDIWYGDKFNEAREILWSCGRERISICKYCDSFRIV